MSVNLVKGQKVELRKETGGSLNHVMVGLGWDEVQPDRKGFLSSLFSAAPEAIDCDASAFVCQNGRIVNKSDVVYFGNLKHNTDCVRHMGDNLTGAGDGMAKARKQHFGMIRNAFIRICDDNGKELCRYNLSENYDNMTAMIFGELYRHNGAWKFNAIGQATTDDSVDMLARRYF